MRRVRRRLAVLALSFTLALPALSMAPPPALAALATTTKVVVHNTKHNVVTSGEVGRAIHPHVEVTGIVGVPTGTVVVQWFSGSSNCSTTVTKQASADLSSGALDATALTITPTEPGLVSFRATYVGNSSYTASQDCEGFAVAKALPPNTSAIHDASHDTVTQVTVGTFIHFNMTLSAVGPLPKPTGNVEVTLYADATCASALTVNTYPVENGAVETNPMSNSVVRVRSFKATYQGDALYRSRTSSCRSIEWVRAALQVKAAIHTSKEATVADTVQLGVEVHPAVTTSGDVGVATGTVDVRWYDGHDCSSLITIFEELSLTNGSLHDPGRVRAQSSLGDRSMRVRYNGESTYNGADSACISWTVVKATPSMSFAIHDADHGAGTTFQLGTAVHPGGRVAPVNGLPDPTGDVNLSFYGNGSCTGSATRTITGIATVGSYFDDQSATATTTQAGSNSIRVRYLGDSRYAAVEKCVAFTVAAPTQPPTQNPSATPAPTAAPGSTDSPTASPDASVGPAPSAGPDGATTEPGVPTPTAPEGSGAAPSGEGATPASSPDTPLPADAGQGGMPIALVFLVIVLALVAAGGFLVRRRTKPAA